MTFAVMHLLSTFFLICFLKLAGILCLFMFPTVSSTYFFKAVVTTLILLFFLFQETNTKLHATQQFFSHWN